MTAWWWLSPEERPWPGKCLNTGVIPASRRPAANARAYSVTRAGSAEKERSPITAASGWSETSSDGAKSTVTPMPARNAPRSRAVVRTCSGVMVAAMTRAEGIGPA